MKKIVVLGLVGLFTLLIAFGWMVIAEKQAVNDFVKALIHEYEAEKSRGYKDCGCGWDIYLKAVRDSSETIAINPNNAKAYFTRGWAYEQLGFYKAAIESYRKALDFDLDYKEAQESLEKLEMRK
jgi:tetratricopeptide (TPR) repeat protein